MSPAAASRPFALRVDELGQRIVPAVTATFRRRAGILSVFGDAQDNTITVSRDAAGKILVNGGAVAVLRRHRRPSPTRP